MLETNSPDRLLDNDLDLTRFDLSVSAPSLRGHIANEHMMPSVLGLVGIPKEDINLARHLKYDLDWVIKRLEALLTLSDQEIAERIVNEGMERVLSAGSYKFLVY